MPDYLPAATRNFTTNDLFEEEEGERCALTFCPAVVVQVIHIFFFCSCLYNNHLNSFRLV